MAVRYWQSSTSASAVRGMSFNILFLDEFAFVPNHIADSFFASVYPTITSGPINKSNYGFYPSRDEPLLQNVA